MADISNVDTATIKSLYTELESLPCKTHPTFPPMIHSPNISLARIMTRILY